MSRRRRVGPRGPSWAQRGEKPRLRVIENPYLKGLAETFRRMGLEPLARERSRPPPAPALEPGFSEYGTGVTEIWRVLKPSGEVAQTLLQIEDAVVPALPWHGQSREPTPLDVPSPTPCEWTTLPFGFGADIGEPPRVGPVVKGDTPHMVVNGGWLAMADFQPGAPFAIFIGCGLVVLATRGVPRAATDEEPAASP